MTDDGMAIVDAVIQEAAHDLGLVAQRSDRHTEAERGMRRIAAAWRSDPRVVACVGGVATWDGATHTGDGWLDVTARHPLPCITISILIRSKED